MPDTPRDPEKVLADVEAQATKPPTPPRQQQQPARRPSARSIETRMTDLFGSLGIMWALADSTCGMALVEQSPALGEAFDKLAQESPRVKRMLERILEGGAWGGVIAAASPVLIAVLRHHNLIPGAVAAMDDAEALAAAAAKGVSGNGDGTITDH